MLQQRQFLSGVMAAAVGLLAVSASVQTAERTMEANKQGWRSVEQRRFEERKRLETDRKWVLGQIIGEEATGEDASFEQSIITDSEILRAHLRSSSSTPPPSPGLDIGVTFYDLQAVASQAYNLARTPTGEWIHFTWTNMTLDLFEPGSTRNLKYMAVDPEAQVTIPEGYNGYAFTTAGNHAGHSNIDVNVNNVPYIGFHMREEDQLDPYSAWAVSFPFAPDTNANFMQLGGTDGSCAEVLWARLTADRSNEVLHEVAHSNINDCPTHKLWYWRFNPTLGMWQGPAHIDDTEEISYVLAVDATSDKVAVAVHVTVGGLSNVAFLETASDGLNWINGSEIPPNKTQITNYTDLNGPQAWVHLTTTYDNSGVLHIMWDEQRQPGSGHAAIKHWNSNRNSIRTAAIGDWDNPQPNGIFNLNFSKLTMGIGDGSTQCESGSGSNDNYVYALYTQFGGPTPAEQADHSALPGPFVGYMNGELYLTVSNSGGLTWSTPINLTNTKTPSCYPGMADQFSGEPQYPDSVCRSENWATIGRVVHDIDIFLISDVDAGSSPHGEGSWQLNRIHYLQLEGGTTNAAFVCPVIAPNFAATLSSDPACEYHASQFGQDEATLTIMNLGNADLEGEISILDFPGAPELSISAPGPYTITAGDPDLLLTVTMAANSAPEGLYSGTIVITHNDTSQPSPLEFAVDFFILNEFYCPQDPVWLRTGVPSGGEPGSLTLGVGEDGSIANEQEQGGLWRHSDSSSSIFDGSLLIAHGAQGPDTTVFLSFSTRPTNGQNGFRPQSEFVIDTSAYGTGTGCATAYAKMSTKDSVVGISVEWFYPQDLGRDEFILARYKFYRFTPEIPVSDLAIGMLIDFDVLPALRLGAVQDDARNAPGSDVTRNLLWVRGVDTAGHIPTGENTATRFRAGMILPDGFEGALVGNSADDIIPDGGPSDELLYHYLQNLSGIDLYTVSDTDLYAIGALAKGQSIAAGETLGFSIIFVSDTVSEQSLLETADAAIAAAPYLCLGCVCPCAYDPQCDGVTSDILDISMVVDVAFRGVTAPSDPGCPATRTDVNANGVTDVLDVNAVINVAFRGQSVSANYVDPCAP